MFFFSLTFLHFSTDIFICHIIPFFVLISIFIIRIFLSSSNFFIPFPFLPLISIPSIPISFLYHSSRILSLSVFPPPISFFTSPCRLYVSVSHSRARGFLVSSSSKREVRLEVCFVSRTRASLEFLSLRSRRSRSTDSPHPSFLPASPDDSDIRYNEFRSSYFQGNVIGDV